ncbi:MAG TPA: TetR/AcrR family transcriptional regulator [Bryobacteraceae bacterium]|nr:TetR/AcrR family transcriptional regulator [Bryobacteraceae bacterium]
MNASVRRTPVQERSNETVHQILKAASELLATEPMDQLTTSRVAQAAGVSVGGLYRFFPDKQSIIDAIAVKHVEDLRVELEKRLSVELPQDGSVLLSMIVDAYMAFLDERPDFRAIALGRHVSTLTKNQQASPDVGPAALVKKFILDRIGMDAGALDIKIRVASEAGERLIAYAYEQPLENRSAVIAEMKTMLAGYFFSVSSSPSPSR